MLYLGIFGGDFKKLLPYLKSSLWNFWNFKVSSRAKKVLNVVPKMSFGVNIGEKLKKLLSYLKSALSDLSNVKITLTLASEMTCFGTFRPESEKELVPYLKSALWNLPNFKVSSRNIFCVNCRENLKKLSYLKSATLNLSNAKFSSKTKKP